MNYTLALGLKTFFVVESSYALAEKAALNGTRNIMATLHKTWLLYFVLRNWPKLLFTTKVLPILLLIMILATFFFSITTTLLFYFVTKIIPDFAVLECRV